MAGEKSQIDKFREAARAFGADPSDAEYEAAASKVAKAPKLTDAEIKAMARELRNSNRGKGTNNPESR